MINRRKNLFILVILDGILFTWGFKYFLFYFLYFPSGTFFFSSVDVSSLLMIFFRFYGFAILKFIFIFYLSTVLNFYFRIPRETCLLVTSIIRIGILTSSLLSKLAFLKEEVTELASFSSIHALKSLTAKEAAMPTENKNIISKEVVMFI